MSHGNKPDWPKWVRDDGSVVSCTEKVKVMTENFDELKQIAQDALEDGLLMEVSEAQIPKTPKPHSLRWKKSK